MISPCLPLTRWRRIYHAIVHRTICPLRRRGGRAMLTRMVGIVGCTRGMRGMRITGIETYFVKIAANLRTWLFVKVTTDAGVHGWGEGTLEGKERVVAAAIEGYAVQHGIIGMDPRQIERIWQVQYRHGFWRGGVVLNSAI